jgi:hypothetical protein
VNIMPSTYNDSTYHAFHPVLAFWHDLSRVCEGERGPHVVRQTVVDVQAWRGVSSKLDAASSRCIVNICWRNSVRSKGEVTGDPSNDGGGS